MDARLAPAVFASATAIKLCHIGKPSEENGEDIIENDNKNRDK